MNSTKTTKTSKKAAAPSKAPIAHGVGRRKSAVARVWLRKGSKKEGSIVINGKAFNEYFPASLTQHVYEMGEVYAPVADFDVEVNVCGGGLNGQADAIKLGIARALGTIDEQARLVFRDSGLLTVDSRVKERKKYGQKAARRKFQFVKR